ncbi:MAG: cell division protein SepF [Clostridia bacterium]
MSYINTLKSGEIPAKTAKKRKQTPYDEYMAKKVLKVKDGGKDVAIIQPKSFDDVQKIIDGLKDGHGAIADFSISPPEISQRILDFLSGAAYGLDGKIECIDKKILLITPKDIQIVNKL